MIEIDGTTYYVSQEIAKETAYSFTTVLRYAHLNNMQLLGYKQKVLFSEEQKNKIVEFLKEKALTDPSKQKILKSINTKVKEVTIEEQRKLHPLVTDDRFFKESFFPDVIPNVLEETID